MTQHHLLPKARRQAGASRAVLQAVPQTDSRGVFQRAIGGKAEHRLPFCRPCHKQIHATFSDKQLAGASYHTIELLRRASGAGERCLAWIRKQKPDRNFRTITS